MDDAVCKRCNGHLKFFFHFWLPAFDNKGDFYSEAFEICGKCMGDVRNLLKGCKVGDDKKSEEVVLEAENKK